MSKIVNQYFDKSIIDVIKSRHSVRTYNPENLSLDIKNKLVKYAEGVKGPFHPKVRLELIHDIDAIERTGGKIGTYGVIKGTKSYIAAAVEKGEKDLEQLGYSLEKLILYATSLELGTCWLGGTFKRSEFAKVIGLKDHEILPIVTPIGYISDKKRIVDSLMRLGAGSNNRKQWKELFFNENFNTSLSEQESGKYHQALEMLRLAPSASNKQPWRILKVGNTYHFYLKSTQGYGKALGFNIQRIDIGIAMCHFEMTLDEQGISGRWSIIDKQPNIDLPENMQYIVSWVQD